MSGYGSYDYDIAVLSDFRYPGGTSASLAEEIRAQSAAGYTTALVPARAANLKRKRGFNPRIVSCVQAGMAEVVAPDQEVRARVLIVRQPSILVESPEPEPRVKADKVVMVVNQIHNGQTPGGDPFDLAEARDRIHELFGDQTIWAPIGPVVREALTGTGVDLNMTQADWHNVLNADEWYVDRAGYAGNRPVIGRHARPHWKKWPTSAEEILAAYPDDDELRVKILGGGEVATKILGRTPSNWTLYPFNSMPPARFLRELDFQVYYHHPDEPEAFGRTVAEALASGLPTIVSKDFEPLFEDSCIYARPEQVREIVRGLYDNPEAYRERAERAHSFVKERFDYSVHERRIGELIGEPASRPPTRRASRSGRTMVFFTSNGVGMGHLTRMMSITRRMPDNIRPVFVTLSTGMRVVRDAGYFCEFIPRLPGHQPKEWNAFLEQRLTQIIGRYDAEALVFDGTVPFQGLLDAKAATGIPAAWVRRGMWRRGRGERNLNRAEHFETIIEPGEFAQEYDQGGTVAQRGEVVSVPPILLLDPSELLDGNEAREALGLSPTKTTVLVGLGAGNEGETESLPNLTVDRLLRHPEIEVVFAEWVISRTQVELPEAVKHLSTYPIARYLNAFDFSISAAGYNSFHERMGFAVPTIFIPTETQLDDQFGRGRYAESVGAGMSLEPFSEAGLDRLINHMLVKENRQAISARCRELFPGNGAEEAMREVVKLLTMAPGEAQA